MSLPLFILYAGLIFWTVGYDTIYACQDIEDDMKIGVKSTARRFGKRGKLGVWICYVLCFLFISKAGFMEFFLENGPPSITFEFWDFITTSPILFPFLAILLWQVFTLKEQNGKNVLNRFKSNFWAGVVLILVILAPSYLINEHYRDHYCESRQNELCERRGY